MKIKNFKNFLYLCFQHLKITPTDLQYAVADILNGREPRIVLCAYRGFGKSWLLATYALFELYSDPSVNILVVSASVSKSLEFSNFCMKLMEVVPELNYMLPQNKKDRTSRLAFDISGAPPSQAPSFKASGIFGQITGSRATIIIADDVETPNTAETQSMREKLSERVKEFESILKLEGWTRIVFLGTPQVEESLYNKLVERGYTKILIPARYPGVKWMEHNGDYLLSSLRDCITDKNTIGFGSDGTLGACTDTKRYSETQLEAKELSYGRSGFLLQFMVDSSLADQDRYPLKLKDLIVMDFNDMGVDQPIWGTPIQDLTNIGLKGDCWMTAVGFKGEWRKFEGGILSVDPAGRGEDELAYAVVKQLNGFVYIAEVGGMSDGYSDANLETLALVAKKHGCNSVVVESNFGDGMFSKLLRQSLSKSYPCPIQEISNRRQKELRIIEVLEPIMNSHRLVVNRSVIQDDNNYDQSKRLFYQLTRITKDRRSLSHDDRLDAVAMGVDYYREALARDADKAMEQQRIREIKRVLEHSISNDVRNKGNRNKGWLSKIIGNR